MKLFLIIFFVVVVLVGVFCLYVMCTISSEYSRNEEQREIERMLLDEKRKSKQSKK